MGEIQTQTLDKTLTVTLPPGCRFYPSETTLISHYLTHKVTNTLSNFKFSNVIPTLNISLYDPFDLPDSACFRYGKGGRKRHWYFYVEKNEKRERKAGGGFWRNKGKRRDILGEKNIVIGTRKGFVFYLDSVKTDWVLYEYALLDRHEVSFVLCRVLVKLSRRCKGSDNVLSSCGEQSFSTVRDIGIQHDGNKTSSIRETVVQDDDSVDKKDEALKLKFGLAVDNQITTQEVPVAGAGVELLPHEQVTSSRRSRDGGASFLSAQHLVTFLEEDYIELDDLTEQLVSNLEEDYIGLDDLTSPFLGIDFT